jgi:hypothetical protein
VRVVALVGERCRRTESSTATVRVGEWMASFNTFWVTTMRHQLPGVALGVSGGPRPVCPWLCMGMGAGLDTALLVSTCPMPTFPVPRELAGQSGAGAP